MKLPKTHLASMIVLLACSSPKETATSDKKTFADDVNFLREYTDIVILESEDQKIQLAVCPALQGRVMTSSANGSSGFSFGWINRNAFLSKDTSAHMNAFGGEDRFWLGPEGGQFSIYFQKGSEFSFDNWHVPKIIDIEPFDLASVSKNNAVFRREGKVTNYSGTQFNFLIRRSIELLSLQKVGKLLGSAISDSISAVGYQSVNVLKNVGTEPWRRETGLLSIWILGMFNPSPNAIVFLPLNKNVNEDSLLINDTYFGKVPRDRLIIKNHVAFFKADGLMRTKIGLPPRMATEWAGSYDAANNILTIVHYNKPSGNFGYVNSLWEIQKEPFNGDVVNAYNDGPPEPGVKPMGPFYEIETSSPAAALSVGDSIVHTHTTVHVQGSGNKLDEISTRLFGLSVKEIASAFENNDDK